MEADQEANCETDVSNQLPTEKRIEDKSEVPINTQRMSIATEVLSIPNENRPRLSIGSREAHIMVS